jgi:hypothetical protein
MEILRRTQKERPGIKIKITVKTGTVFDGLIVG